MKGNQQFVLLAYIVFALTFAAFFAKGLGALFGYAGIYDYQIVGQNITLTTLIGVAIGGGLGFYAWNNEDWRSVSTEIVVELGKVTWPNIKPWFSTKSEVWAAAYVVIVTTIIFALILGVFDLFWSWMTGHIYG